MYCFDKVILACKNTSINVCMKLNINIYFSHYFCVFFKGNIGQASQETGGEDKKMLNNVNASVVYLVYFEFTVIVCMRCYSHDAYI